MKYLSISILFCSLFLFSFTSTQNSDKPFTIIENKAKLPILTPDFSERKVSKIQLQNGLEAILISDPKLTQSSAAIIVKAGSWQNPKEYPGIAHFLEHMLFLGTKKYPQESSYFRYIDEHGGQANAFTTNTFTSFMFSINNDGFPEALDRFSFFFKEPLFNPSGVSRELHAIDQEYSNNLNDDDVKGLYVLKDILNPEHPDHQFDIGNSGTLSKVSQETLKNWYENHYSSNLMRLIIYSPLPLEQLQKMVVDDFSEIPNKEKSEFKPQIPLFTAEQMGHYIYFFPSKQAQSVSLLWDLPFEFSKMLSTKPGELICFVLGHEGPKSLLAELKRQNLAEALSCGPEKIGGSNSIFDIQIALTNLGIEKIDTVLDLTFQAIQGLKEQGIPEYIFKEVQTMALLNYQYQPRENAFNLVFKQALTLGDEDLSTYPEHTKIIQSYDPKAVNDLLQLLTPERAVILVEGTEKQTGVPPEQHEKWLQSSYSIRPIPEKTLERWANIGPNPQMTLPDPNPFLPEADLFSKLPETEKFQNLPHPELLINDISGKLYAGGDTLYGIPKVFWSFEILSPELTPNKATNAALTELLVQAVKGSLDPYSYSAKLANLNFTIEPSKRGLIVTLEGYGDKAPLLFQQILSHLKNPDMTEEQYKIYKEILLRDYKNFSKEDPLDQGEQYLKEIIYKSYMLPFQKAQALQKIGYDKFQSWLASAFQKTYVKGLMYGNTDQSQVKQLWQDLQNTLKSKPFPLSQQPPLLVIDLPPNKGPFYYEKAIDSRGNGVLLAIENGHYSLEERGALQVLMQGIKQPFFSELRTVQQTGYLVTSWSEDIEHHLWGYFAVQSNTHNPRDLLARFELFIEKFLQEMNETTISEARFTLLKEAVLTNLKEQPKSLREMGLILRTLAFDFNGNFDWISMRIKTLEELSYENFLKFAENFLGRNNKRRIAILLDGEISDEYQFNYQSITQLNQIKKMAKFTAK